MKTFLEVIVVIMIPLIFTACMPSGNHYKDVCISGVVYIEDSYCSKCQLIPKIDAQTLQPQRCTVEKVP